MTCRGAGGAGGACLVVTPGAAQDPGLYAGLDADADDGGLAMLGCSGLPLLDSTGLVGVGHDAADRVVHRSLLSCNPKDSRTKQSRD